MLHGFCIVVARIGALREPVLVVVISEERVLSTRVQNIMEGTVTVDMGFLLVMVGGTIQPWPVLGISIIPFSGFRSHAYITFFSQFKD
jgi:hypothetical protein